MLKTKEQYMKLTAESTVINDAKLDEDISEVKGIATNTAQYFWFTETGTDTGAHISEVTQEEFKDNPSGGNLLANSNGIAVRDGMDELATFGKDKIALRDGNEDLFSVFAGTGDAIVTQAIDAQIDFGDKNTSGRFALGRQIKEVVLLTVEYSVGGVTKTLTYTSVPVNTYNSDLSRIEIYVISDGNVTAVNYLFQKNSSVTASVIINKVTIEFETDNTTTEIIAGSHSDDTYSSALRIGNGISNEGESNAMSLSWDGTMHLMSDVKVFCNADSSGGVSLGQLTDLGTLYYSDEGAGTASETELKLTGYRCGRIVSLQIELGCTASTSAGETIVTKVVTNRGVPVPLGNVSGVAYYGVRPIVATLFGTAGSLRLTVRNVGSTAVTFPMNDKLYMSITYLTAD